MSSSKQLNSQEFRVTKCELCGSLVKSVGKTTQHYEPILSERKAAEMQSALELIAAPKRSDGTYNRDREACGELARVTLAKVANDGL